MPYLQFFRLTGSRWTMLPINTSYFLGMSGLTAFLVFSCFCRPECSGYWHVCRGRQIFQSDFYVSHRSIVLRAVQGKGHKANPTCWEWSEILVLNLLAGSGATFATDHQYYFDSQQALSSWVHVSTRNKMIPLWSLISTCVPYFDFEITEPLRNYIMASGFTREVIKRTSVEAASHQNAIFQRSKSRDFSKI